MAFNPGLAQGQTISNQDLRHIFQCGTQGGMRRSRTTDTLVLISDMSKGFYQDREWIDGIFYYTGMGKTGDQELTYMQNRTLEESGTNGVDVFLFVVHSPGQYIFEGQVELASPPFQEDQPDYQGVIRKTWVFPLKLAGTPTSLPAQPKVLVDQEKKLKEIKEKLEKNQLSKADLEKQAREVKGKPKVVNSLTPRYVRSALVEEYAKARANGKCQLCQQDAPFKTPSGEPYLECHHIIWLSQGGDDTIENTVALCPNCHRKIHSNPQPGEIQALKKAASRP